MSMQFTNWKKSSRSNGTGNCVEVASVPGAVGVRDSTLGDDSPVLAVSPAGWTAFVAGIRAGRFDR